MAVNKAKQNKFLKSLQKKKKQEKRLEKESKKLNNRQKKQNQRSNAEKAGIGVKSTKGSTSAKNTKQNNTVKSNAEKIGVGYQKQSESRNIAPKKSMIQNPFSDKVISDESIKRTKLQTDLTFKNGFASAKSEKLRKKADESINPYKKKNAKKELAASVFDDEYKRIRTAHPEMEEKEILRFLSSRKDYGQAFTDEVSNRQEKHNRQIDELKNAGYGSDTVSRYSQKGESGLTEEERFSRKAAEKGLTEIGLAFSDLAFKTGNSKQKAADTAKGVWSEFMQENNGDVTAAIKYMDDNLLGVKSSVLLDELKKTAETERKKYVQRNLARADRQTRENILSGKNIDPRQAYESGEYQKAVDTNRAYNLMDATTATTNKLQNAGRAVGQGYLSTYAGAARLADEFLGGSRGENAVRLVDEMAIANKASAKTKVGRVGVDILSQIGLQLANAPMMILGGAGKGAKALQTAITGSGYGISTAGQELQHAYDSGASETQARKSAAVSALLEVAFGGLSEGIFIKIFGRNANAGGSYIANALKKVMAEAGIEAGMEGITEYLTSVGQNTASRMIYDNPKEQSFFEILKDELGNMDNFYAAALGAAMGGGMGAAGGIGNVREARQAQYIREFAQKAGMSEQEVTAAVNEGRIRELAAFAQDRSDAKSQAGNFVSDVQKCIMGEMPSGDVLIVNKKTPRILQKYGAADRTMSMSQSVVRKIAYPEGYMGGKHNLGFGALAKLPEQLADPMAVLKSASQKNSLVVITELVDAENRPVIVPIHLDKNGRIGLSNEIPSMYSKDGYANFVKAQEKAGNIVFTRKNGNISVAKPGLNEKIYKNISQNAVSVQELSGEKLKNYRRMSSFAEAKGGSVVVRNDMEPGNPGYVIKNADGRFVIYAADEALADYVVFGHELTHVLEGTKEYAEYAGFVLGELAGRGADIAAIQQRITGIYAEHGRELDAELAEKEMIAMYTAKHLFDDQVVINRLAAEKPNLFQRIWEWLQDAIGKLRGEDSAFYIETRKRFVEAYRAAGGAKGGRWGEGVRQDWLNPKFEYQYDNWIKNGRKYNGYKGENKGNIRQNSRQNSIDFDIDEIISDSQKEDGKAWSETVKEFDNVKKKVKTDGGGQKAKLTKYQRHMIESVANANFRALSYVDDIFKSRKARKGLEERLGRKFADKKEVIEYINEEKRKQKANNPPVQGEKLGNRRRLTDFEKYLTDSFVGRGFLSQDDMKALLNNERVLNEVQKRTGFKPKNEKEIRDYLDGVKGHDRWLQGVF